MGTALGVAQYHRALPRLAGADDDEVGKLEALGDAELGGELVAVERLVDGDARLPQRVEDEVRAALGLGANLEEVEARVLRREGARGGRGLRLPGRNGCLTPPDNHF